MKKAGLILITCVLLSGVVSAQERIPVELEKHRLYINILSPGISYELGLSERLSLHSKLGISTYWGNNNTNSENFEDQYISVNPYLDVTLRNYYPRKKVKKELDLNSGNFVGASVGYIFPAITEKNKLPGTENFANSVYLGGLWGIQRNYKSGIHLGLSLGGGISFGQNIENYSFAPVGGFEFGFTLK